MTHTKKFGEVYKCGICGNIVEVLFVGGGELVCCGKPMERLLEKSTEEGLEKHLPVIEETKTGVKIIVGSISHPMETKHHIMWIEIWGKENCLSRKYLKPGEVSEAEYNFKKSEILFVRELCNLHGLWKKSN